MKQSDLVNQQNQNYLDLDTLSTWINENIPHQRSSPIKNLLQKQTLIPTANQKIKKDLLKQHQERVHKNNRILSELINPEHKLRKLELMEAQYDSQACEKTLMKILTTAPKYQAQESNLPIVKRKKVDSRTCELIKLIQAERSQTKMMPQKTANHNLQTQNNSIQQIAPIIVPQSTNNRNAMEEEQQENFKSQYEFVDQCIKDLNDYDAWEYSIQANNNALQDFEVQQFKPTEKPEEKKASSPMKQQQIEPQFIELKTQKQQFQLEPLDAQKQILEQSLIQQTQRIQANQMTQNNPNLMEEQ